MQATVTHEHDEHAGHLYYVRLDDRAPKPYRAQRRVTAIVDIADDGTLAGVELIDNMPPPPETKSAVTYEEAASAVGGTSVTDPTPGLLPVTVFKKQT